MPPFHERKVPGKPLRFSVEVLFESGRAVVTPQGKAVLDDLLNKIGAIYFEELTADGHADSTGNAAVNRALSVRRAEAVRAYLFSKGIELSRMRVQSHGTDVPRAGNRRPEDRARNRRVEIEVRGAQWGVMRISRAALTPLVPCTLVNNLPTPGDSDSWDGAVGLLGMVRLARIGPLQ